MMSPDPPRNGNDVPDPGSAPFQYADDFDDTDVMGVGEHVLDYSSQPESWTSEDELEDTIGASGIDEVDEVGNIRTRTQYRMLIPFQIDTEDSFDESSPTLEQVVHVSDPQLPTDQVQDPVANTDVLPGSSEAVLDKTGDKPETREIALTDENVQKIKEAMQSFKLPDSAIPKWAKDVTEDSWRGKLSTTLESTSRLPP